MLSAGSRTFSYDNEGQLASSGPTDYTFNYDHRLSAIGSSAAFSYDGRGNRLRGVRSGVTTRYVHDAAGNLLAEADGSNNILRYYIYGVGLLAMVTPANDLYCYHFDALGSTVAVTNASQTMVNQYAYDVFGNVKNQVETIPQPFKYVGQFGVMAEPEGFYYTR